MLLDAHAHPIGDRSSASRQSRHGETCGIAAHMVSVNPRPLFDDRGQKIMRQVGGSKCAPKINRLNLALPLLERGSERRVARPAVQDLPCLRVMLDLSRR